MSNTPKDGGPAFPTTESHENPNWPGTRDVYAASGMTLRAYFAGQALLGLLSDPNNMSNAEVNAQAAVVSADALIAELAKGAAQ